MKPEAIFDYIFVDGECEKISESMVFEKVTGTAIYEVIRVSGGRPLFLEDHLARMFQSAGLIEFKIGYDKSQIEAFVANLISANEIDNNNIKILAAETKEGNNIFLVYAVKSFYPPESYYRDGVNTISFRHQRATPNAKVQHSEFRERVKEAMDKADAFEALLVNEEGYILEGSRSNMFYVMDEVLFTAPASDVLLGITRKHIIKMAENMGYKVRERRLHESELKKVEGLFISGTSIGVLPVSKVNGTRLETAKNKLVIGLVEEYRKI